MEDVELEIGDGNGRRLQPPVSGSAVSSVRECSCKGNSGQRKRAREVSGNEGARVERFGLSAVQVSEIVIMVCYECNFGKTM